jgi:hypothetical protein
MSRFTISSSKDTGLNFSLDNTLEETDVEDMLSFSDEQIEDLLHTHAATQAYWEAFALRQKTKLETFQQEWKKKWWAHNKKFAKDLLCSYGETKATIDSVNDTVINIFSQDTSELQREQFANSAYAYASKKASCKDSFEEYKLGMYKYLTEFADQNGEIVPWYYETLVTYEATLCEHYEVVRIVAERLNAKSFHMKEVLALTVQKEGNTGVRDPRNERSLMTRSGKEK